MNKYIAQIILARQDDQPQDDQDQDIDYHDHDERNYMPGWSSFSTLTRSKMQGQKTAARIISLRRSAIQAT